MTPDQRNALRADVLLSVLLIAGGLVLIELSLVQLSSRGEWHLAQAVNSGESQPSAPAADGPAKSTPQGARPTTPAPEPARPDALKAGARPALPPAPAEKMGEPIKK